MPVGRTGFIDDLSSDVDGPVNNLLVFCPMSDHAQAELCGFQYSSSVLHSRIRRALAVEQRNGKSRGRKTSPQKSRKIISQITFAVPLLLPRLYHNVLYDTSVGDLEMNV